MTNRSENGSRKDYALQMGEVSLELRPMLNFIHSRYGMGQPFDYKSQYLKLPPYFTRKEFNEAVAALIDGGFLLAAEEYEIPNTASNPAHWVKAKIL